jgi:phosphoribosylamine--glycine ligase
MKRHQIPSAAYEQFDIDSYNEGISYLQNHSLPIVLKADGLASGKGVVICKTHQEALTEFEMMLQKSKFGEAGRKVVVEEFLEGIELSVFVLTDGNSYFLLPEAKDYKRIGEGDTGLNTGGMGAVSPVPFATSDFMFDVQESVIRPTISGLAKEGIRYQGVIFFGLIKVGEKPFVIEYNCRFGDPETEVVIPRLENDLVELLEATAKQQLHLFTARKDERAACTIVAVSGGYPGSFEKGFIIEGLDNATRGSSLLFHAATAEHNGKVVTNGGRVFCVTSFGDSIPEALSASNDVLRQIHFANMYYRTDIGYEF